jgi:hypothetical protein
MVVLALIVSREGKKLVLISINRVKHRVKKQWFENMESALHYLKERPWKLKANQIIIIEEEINKDYDFENLLKRTRLYTGTNSKLSKQARTTRI